MLSPAREHYVYILYREDGVTPFYVGIGKGNRWLAHERNAHKEKNHKAAVIRKIHAQRLQVIKRKVAENFTREQACQLERSLIRAIGRKPHGPLTNCTGGGEGHYAPLPESRAKLVLNGKMHLGRKRTASTLAKKSEATRKQMASPEARARIAEKLKGHGFSEESLRKMRATRNTPESKAAASAAAKARWADPAMRQKIIKGLRARAPFSDEARLKMRLKKVGRKLSDAVRQNMALAQQRRRQQERESS